MRNVVDGDPAAAYLGRLADAVSALVDARNGLLDQLHELLPAQVGNGLATGTIARQPAGSSEPWHGEAASVYWLIHAGARNVEAGLREQRGLLPAARGGAHAVTVATLTALVGLAVGVEAATIEQAAVRVERWVSAARRIHDIDLEERWSPVPRVPGALPPFCPYCGNLSLRMALSRGEVRCFTPDCADLDGHPPVARMEGGGLTGGSIVFRDSTVVHFREDTEPKGRP